MALATSRDTIARRVRRTLDDADASLVGARVLAMCSGGADSVALVALLGTLPRGAAPASIDVLSIDYGLRDTTTELDAARAAAEHVGATWHVHRGGFDPAAGASFEAAARAWRYDVARALARQLGCDVICTGHTASDQLEQALLALAGVTGAAGRLDAMPVARTLDDQLQLVRPLLALAREDTERACSDAGLAWADDPTNADPDAHVRNAVRHRVVAPLLEVAPGAGQAIVRAARREQDRAGTTRAIADTLLDAWSPDPADPEAAVDVRRLAPLPPGARREVIAAWMTRAGAGRLLTTRAVTAVDRLALLPGRAACARVDLGRGTCVRRDGYHLAITNLPDTEGPTP